MDVRSRAFASLTPEDGELFDLPVSTLKGMPRGAEEPLGTRKGLWASLSIRSDASATLSAPAQGVAAAISRVSLPTLDGSSASASALAF